MVIFGLISYVNHFHFKNVRAFVLTLNDKNLHINAQQLRKTEENRNITNSYLNIKSSRLCRKYL